jgi:hypothetical protein
MNVSYYFASAKGDVRVDDATLERPFIVPPVQPHPFMTLRDYFASVRDFVLRNGRVSLASLVAQLWGKRAGPDDIDDLVIRYEKYGTLYQICSIDVSAAGEKAMFVVSTAMSALAKETLNHEFDLLQKLNSRHTPSYLPRVHWKDAVIIQKEANKETLLMSLSEWFRGYHEWHFARDEQGKEGVIIWDMVGGYRLASEKEVYEIIRQASKILTLYYDTRTYHRIYPWHHGAGDFVLKTGGGAPSVKLITVRDYEPLALPVDLKQAGSLSAITLFFLELTVKMRLDKKEGMGESIWAGDYVLPAVMAGFLEALKVKESEGTDDAPSADVFMSYLKSLGADDIRKMLHACLNEFRLHDQSDFTAVAPELDSHAKSLVRLCH